MKEEKENIVKFNGYSIKKIILEQYKILKKDENKKNKMDITFELLKKNDEHSYCLNMNVKTLTEKFKIEISISGFFEFSKDTESELVDNFMKITAPTVLYPYCRSFISSITSLDSNQAVILPIVNFANLINKNE